VRQVTWASELVREMPAWAPVPTLALVVVVVWVSEPSALNLALMPASPGSEMSRVAEVAEVSAGAR